MHVKIYTEDQHKIDQELIDKDALHIIFSLKQKGFDAFLVGGSVRDLILKKRPKDFDIATSARPEEIKRVFGSKCLLIGRRFRLAHLRFGKKIIEVSTFRSGNIDSDTLIVRDNSWGSAEDDVLRRDFTINALFYDPTTHTVYDYIGGFPDVQAKILRTIGDASSRFKQDPVRMLRLLKFRARFSFHVDEKTEYALNHSLPEIVKSSPARILEEFLKMLESGAAYPFFSLLKEYGFLDLLFPPFAHLFEHNYKKDFIATLKEIDALEKKPDRAILLSSLIFPLFQAEITTLNAKREKQLSYHDIMEISYALFKGINAASFCHFPKKLFFLSQHICSMQYRLAPLEGPPRFKGRFTHSNDFNFALQFLDLRSRVKPELRSIYDEWKKNHKEKSNVTEPTKKRKARPFRRRSRLQRGG